MAAQFKQSHWHCTASTPQFPGTMNHSAPPRRKWTPQHIFGMFIVRVGRPPKGETICKVSFTTASSKHLTKSWHKRNRTTLREVARGQQSLGVLATDDAFPSYTGSHPSEASLLVVLQHFDRADAPEVDVNVE